MDLPASRVDAAAPLGEAVEACPAREGKAAPGFRAPGSGQLSQGPGQLHVPGCGRGSEPSENPRALEDDSSTLLGSRGGTAEPGGRRSPGDRGARGTARLLPARLAVYLTPPAPDLLLRSEDCSQNAVSP